MAAGACLSLAAASSAGAGAPRPAPVTAQDFRPFDARQAELGRLLFYDKILSGNRNISCGTCHHHDHAGGDGLSLGIGEGGAGVADARTAGEGRGRIEKRAPRNAPSLFNLGAREVRVLFHDGRLSVSDRYGVGFDSPAEERLPLGLSGPLAAQALFPMTSEVEMAGSPEENEVAVAAYDRIDRVWPILAKRVRTIPDYGARLVAAFDDLDHASDATIVHVANALAAFIDAEWRSYDSRWDLWLAGEAALSPAEHRGRQLFFGEAGCADCHSGKFFTDQRFHALALPPFGPGRTRRWDPYARDVGRMGETNRLEDAYRFRTPALRNVALTAPYGHNGAYPTLEGVVRHHLDPLGALSAWTPDAAALPEAPWLAPRDFVTLQDKREMARLRRRVDLSPVALSDAQVADLVAFLHALTGGESVTGRLGRPEAVPSGLPVD